MNIYRNKTGINLIINHKADEMRERVLCNLVILVLHLLLGGNESGEAGHTLGPGHGDEVGRQVEAGRPLPVRVALLRPTPLQVHVHLRLWDADVLQLDSVLRHPLGAAW